jgi:hypothetical protein
MLEPLWGVSSINNNEATYCASNYNVMYIMRTDRKDRMLMNQCFHARMKEGIICSGSKARQSFSQSCSQEHFLLSKPKFFLFGISIPSSNAIRQMMNAIERCKKKGVALLNIVNSVSTCCRLLVAISFTE